MRYVVIELKTGKFKPEHAGQLQFYVALVEDRLRRASHAPTVGILVCGSRNDRVVRYALNQAGAPLAVSTFSYEALPAGAPQEQILAGDPDSAGQLGLTDAVSALESITQMLAKQGSALGIFIDELQDIDDATLESLLAIQHIASQRQWPFFLIGAGLPNLPARLAECRSYAERQFGYHIIGALNAEDAADAVSVPIERTGGALDPDALDVLVHAASGYPYFLQEYGKAIWSVAETVPFTVDNAHQAVELGMIELDSGFYPSRWDRSSGSEQAYLRAMADTGNDMPRSGEVAGRLGRNASGVSTIRDALIKKGLVWSPEYGKVAFTVPGMADFIRRQPDG